MNTTNPDHAVRSTNSGTFTPEPTHNALHVAGFWPNFGRVVPRVTIVFIVMEQLKANFG